MKKTTGRQLVSLPLASSPEARQLVERARELDTEELRQVIGGGYYGNRPVIT